MGDNNGNTDTRTVCKYGSKCFQKNPFHHAKFRHPPKRRTVTANRQNPAPSDTNKRKSDEDEEEQTKKKVKVSNDVSDSDSDTPAETSKQLSDTDSELAAVKISNDISDSDSESKNAAGNVKKNSADSELAPVKISNDVSDSDSESKNAAGSEQKNLPMDMDVKEFIKEKFLCEMPEDFYKFWDFCAGLRKNNPAEAFSSVGLHLVGPYDVLAGKFAGIKDRPAEEYLLHWRYYYDPPELQTVLKMDKPDGFHIGYFRDDMKDKPVFLASNSPNTDGTFEKIGDNIFAAVFLRLEEIKKTCDPFKKTRVASLISKLKAKAGKHGFELSQQTDSMRKRYVVTQTNNRLGLSVPLNKRSLVGFRELTMTDNDLKELLLKIKSAHPDQMTKLLNDLQPVLTFASIALDECDFGTGVKLGWDILFFGINSLNHTASQFLCNSYNLLKRPEFAKIAKAHMDNRRWSNHPSVLK